MRYLGLDLGTKTLGVALTDKSNTISTPLKTIRFDFEDYESVISELKDIIENNNVGEIALGIPINMDGSKGFAAETFKLFSYYLFSSVGTIIGVWIMVWITIVCRKKNISSYIIIPLAIGASSIIHAIFFFGGIALVEWNWTIYSAYQALGTIIGKVVCILLSILCYFINQNYWKPKKINLAKEEK